MTNLIMGNDTDAAAEIWVTLGGTAGCLQDG